MAAVLAHQERLEGATRHTALRLEWADLYWVTRDMAHAALDASTDIPGWSLEALPAPHGLLAFEPGSLPRLPLVEGRSLGVSHSWITEGLPDDVELSMIQWTTAGEGVGVIVWVAHEWPTSGILPSVVIESIIPGLHDADLTDLDALTGVRPSGRRVLALLGACVTMMATPTVAEARPQQVKLTAAKAGRMPRLQQVTTISLRRLARKVEESEPGESGRVYTHQWVVRGHWRQQAHGPRQSQRRTTWVPSYLKGPEGAPLLYREHVHVWRR